MWLTLIATATAAAICLSVINLAFQINKVRDARHLPVVEFTLPHNVPLRDQSPGTPINAQKNQRSVPFDPGT
jgi:hypothetical protein